MKDGMMNRCESANRSWRHLAPKVLVCLGISLLSGYTAASATGDSRMVESQKIAPADLPERWSYLPEYQIEAPSADDCWWTTFGQAPLDSLIKAGMANNYNVSAAWHRSMAANEAEAAVKNAHAALQTARTPSDTAPSARLSQAMWVRRRSLSAIMWPEKHPLLWSLRL